MAALPDAVQRHLPQGPALQRGGLFSWGVQLYDDDPRYHYEVSRVHPRLGNRLELGLHFESRHPEDNRRMLVGFQARLVEIKAELGESVEAELWDRGWTKVYDTLPLEPYESPFVETVARRLAEMAVVLHPIYRSLRSQAS